MNFERIEHIAVLVDDVKKRAEALKTILGVETVPKLDWKITEDLDGNPKKEQYTLRVAFFKMGNIIVELMQVLEGKSSFYEKAGLGGFHVCFDVEDIKEEIAKLVDQGIKVVESGKIAGTSFAYLDTVESCGFQIELFQKRMRVRKKKKKE